MIVLDPTESNAFCLMCNVKLNLLVFEEDKIIDS